MKKREFTFCGNKPCENCPYRTDAPVRLWAKDEFVDLLKSDRDRLGSVYGCHKKNGNVCVGWLMNQVERDLPSIALRVALSRQEISREYLDGLSSPAPLYASVDEMIAANFPEILNGAVERDVFWEFCAALDRDMKDLNL